MDITLLEKPLMPISINFFSFFFFNFFDVEKIQEL